MWAAMLVTHTKPRWSAFGGTRKQKVPMTGMRDRLRVVPSQCAESGIGIPYGRCGIQTLARFQSLAYPQCRGQVRADILPLGCLRVLADSTEAYWGSGLGTMDVVRIRQACSIWTVAYLAGKRGYEVREARSGLGKLHGSALSWLAAIQSAMMGGSRVRPSHPTSWLNRIR